MARHPGHFCPDHAKVSGFFRNLHVHDAFNRLHIAQSVAERTDTAGTLDDIQIFLKIPVRGKSLKSSVNEADVWDRFNNSLILNHKIQMNRFRQHRMLRSERNYTSLSHQFASSFCPAGASAAPVFSCAVSVETSR